MSDASLIEALKGAASVIENLGFESYDEIVLQLEDLISDVGCSTAENQVGICTEVNCISSRVGGKHCGTTWVLDLEGGGGVIKIFKLGRPSVGQVA